MDWNYVYFRSSVYLSPALFRTSISRILQGPFEMVYDGIEGQLWVDNDGLTCLYNSIMILQNDWLCSFTMLVVPRFDDVMDQVFSKFDEAGLFTLNAVLPKLLNEKLISKNIFNVYFEDISSEVLLTVKNYIELGMSLSLVAKAMYAHRNTINYRINKFCEKSGINVRKTTNAYFIYLVLTWVSKEGVLV
ncbi:TPA: hypothetical protein GXZ54_06030 [bacterium]|jgi:hypothetical protein|nr:hypothetical protein [bacterium]